MCAAPLSARRLVVAITIAFFGGVSTPHLFAQETSPDSATLPQQEKKALVLLTMSYPLIPEIEEHLIGERQLLANIENRLFGELLTPDLISIPLEEASVEVCLTIARAHERAEQPDLQKAALHQALQRAKETGRDGDFQKRSLLQRIAEQLAQCGDYEGANEAALAISREGPGALEVTGMEALHVSASAGQSYALMLVAATAADAGDFADAITSARKIADRYFKAAAYWYISMRQAEQGHVEAVLQTVKLARLEEGLRLFWNQPPTIIEFPIDGPTETQLLGYTSMAAGSIATQQVLDGDEAGAINTVSLVGIPLLEQAIKAEVAANLAESEKYSLAEAWVKKISNREVRSFAKLHVGNFQVLQGDLAAAQQTADAIESPAWRLKLRIELCNAFLKASDTESLAQQIAKMQQTTDAIDVPEHQAAALVQLAKVQIDSDYQVAARKNLVAAYQLVQEAVEDPEVRSHGMVEIAAAMTVVGGADEASQMIDQLVAEAAKGDEFEQARIMQLLVMEQLEYDVNTSIEELAVSIPVPSHRCIALAATASAYAERGQMERSRALFAAAMDSAHEIMDLMGLDTPYSKGGAMRLTAREQASSDMEGLIFYLKQSSDTNIQAYGYLGAAESLVPAAVERAEARGSRYPDGIQESAWHEHLISRILAPP